MIQKIIFFIFIFLSSHFSAYAQNENILCTPWCLAANYDFKTEFGSNDCVYVIDKTPSNQIIITGWCDDIFTITKSKSVTYSTSGTILEYLIDDNGWVESSYITGNETRIFNSNQNIYPTCSEFGPCNTEIEMVQGVECLMAKIISTGQLLYPLDFSQGVNKDQFTLGGRAKIGYIEVPYPSFCQEGEKQVIITCAENGTTNEGDFELCTNFDSYSVGPIVPQGSPLFTLFSNQTSQNASVTSIRSANGSKSLLISNGTNLDYNIARTLTENKVARLDWKIFIASGKSGSFSLETNTPNLYSLKVENSFGDGNLFVKEKVNGIDVLVPKLSFMVKNDKWVQFSLIFQPFEDEIELWVDGKFIYKISAYSSNMITDLNFSRLENSANNEMYVDELCYKEWSHYKVCPQWILPVCVNNINYNNSCEAANDGYSVNEITNGLCGTPLCTSIITPSQDENNIPVNVVIGWNPAQNATKYFLRVGTTPNGGEIIGNLDIGNNLTYYLTNLPYNSKIYVKIQPANNISIISDCQEISFTTQSNSQVPSCASFIYPSNNAQNIPTSANVQWNPSAGANGYKIRVTSDSGTNIILNNYNVNNVTNYVVSNLPNNTLICVKIIPYNIAGDNLNCSESCFKTILINQIPLCSAINSPSNNAQNIPTTYTIKWEPSPSATGYRIKVGTTNNGGDIYNNLNVGNVSQFQLTNLPKNTQICCKIIPYNSAGENNNCGEICFKTEAGIINLSCNDATELKCGVPINGILNTKVSANYSENCNNNAYTNYDKLYFYNATKNGIVNLKFSENLFAGFDITIFKSGCNPNQCIENFYASQDIATFGQSFSVIAGSTYYIVVSEKVIGASGTPEFTIKLTNTECISSSEDFIKNNTVKIIPNPAYESIVISQEDYYPKKLKIKIISMDGKIIRNEFPYSFGDNIDVSDLYSGMYLIIVQTDDNTLVKKLLISDRD